MQNFGEVGSRDELIREEIPFTTHRVRRRRRILTTTHNFSIGRMLHRHSSSYSRRSPPFHDMFKFLIPSLLGFVSAINQIGANKTLRWRDPAIWSFLIAIFVYSLALSQLRRPFHLFRNMSTRYSNMIRRVVVATGVLSSFSLVSLLLPIFPGRLLLYASCALFAILSTWPLLGWQYKWLCRAINIAVDIIISCAKNLFTGVKNEQNTSSEIPWVSP